MTSISSTFDLWAGERERAELLPSGCKMLLGETASGKASIRLWKPNASKPFANYSFPTQEEARKYASKQDERIANHRREVAERRSARRGTAQLIEQVPVGAIFHHSWGYDQTNANFYQVIEKKGRMVVVREIVARNVGNTQGHAMSADCVPVKDSFKKDSKPMGKLLQFSGGKPFITIESFGWCDLWDGRPVSYSWYA